MIIKTILILIIFSFVQHNHTEPTYLGKFNTERDLYLAHFDLKTDVDDVHSVAAVATMLADKRFSKVKYHAVTGAYGNQTGAYVPANELFESAFGKNWSDAHQNFDKAAKEVTLLAIEVLKDGGTVWIAEGGQSDFSATVVRQIYQKLPDADIKSSINIVQHADWNEEVTTPEDLAYVKHAASYHRIPDGNGSGNGTPGFRKDTLINWRNHIKSPRLISIWKTAITLANRYNGVDDRYLNESILLGGLDFSDASESCWIFGFNELLDANEFFQEFSKQPTD